MRKCKATSSSVGRVTKLCIWAKVFAFLCHSAVMHALQRHRVGPQVNWSQKEGGRLTVIAPHLGFSPL